MNNKTVNAHVHVQQMVWINFCVQKFFQNDIVAIMASLFHTTKLGRMETGCQEQPCKRSFWKSYHIFNIVQISLHRVLIPVISFHLHSLLFVWYWCGKAKSFIGYFALWWAIDKFVGRFLSPGNPKTSWTFRRYSKCQQNTKIDQSDYRNLLKLTFIFYKD